MVIKSSLSIFAAFAIFAGIANAQLVSQKFAFVAGKTVTGSTPVLAANIYSKDKGYGFEPGSQIFCKLGTDNCSNDKPFYFSVAVPEGNYRVTVTFGDKTAATSTVIKAELRRLMLESVDTQKGKFVTKSFI